MTGVHQWEEGEAGGRTRQVQVPSFLTSIFKVKLTKSFYKVLPMFAYIVHIPLFLLKDIGHQSEIYVMVYLFGVR